MSRPRAVQSLACALFLAAGLSWADGDHDRPEGPPAQAKPSEVVPGTGFEGRVVVDGQVTPGARVYAYKSFTDFVDSKPLAVSATTGDDGRYTLDLPKGSYYLVAKKREGKGEDGPVAAGDLFSFQGSNPVTVVSGRYTHVGFSMLPFAKPAAYEPSADAGSGSLAGVVTSGGAPLPGAYVSIYLDGKEDLRGAPYASTPPTGKEGAFRLDALPESGFFVIARKRASGKGAGPLTDGDYFAYYPGNPVLVRTGQVARIELQAVTKAGEVGKDDSLFRDTGTRITGRVLDKEGKVVKGVYVFAYEEKVMAHKRPEHISREVDAEGRYVLHLAVGGTYYIGARSTYGDTPALGEWYGRYEGTGDHSIQVKTGAALENVDLVVERILP